MLLQENSTGPPTTSYMRPSRLGFIGYETKFPWDKIAGTNAASEEISVSILQAPTSFLFF